MKKICLIGWVLLFGTVLLNGQERYPNAVPGPEGIYVHCGNRIPRDFAYRVLRRARGAKTWEELALLSCENNFDRFFNRVMLAAAHNPVYELPSDQSKGVIWNYVRSAALTDSIPLFGSFPVYREALGVTWYDGTAEEGKPYEYKVVTLKAGREPVEQTTSSVQFPPLKRKDYKLQEVGREVKQGGIDLSFRVGDREDLYAVRLMRAYYLQSDFAPVFGAAGFQISEEQELLAVASDTSALYRGIVQYYMQPYDMYGNPGQPSETVRLTNMTDLDETHHTGLKARGTDDGIRLSWSFEKPEFLQSIDLYKAVGYQDSIEYSYLLSMPPQDTCYLDTDVEPAQIYSYKLVVNNAYGQSPLSMGTMGIYNGSRPAETPLDLEAEVDMDVVKLSWRRPSLDTKAYYVLRGGGDASDLLAVGGVVESDSLLVTYVDSVRNVPGTTLSYAVRAENTSRNFSPPTEPVFVNPLRDIPLSVPVNVATRYGDGRVWVTWDPVDDRDENVLDYRVERRALTPGAEAPFEPILTSKLLLNYYEDAEVQEGVTYEYRVVSVGAHGQVSEPSLPSSCLVPAVVPISITSLQVHQARDGYRLAWEKTGQENIANYKVYRVQEGQAPKLLATLKPEEILYFDPMKPDNVIYLYAVTCVGTNGVESEVVQWMGAN